MSNVLTEYRGRSPHEEIGLTEAPSAIPVEVIMVSTRDVTHRVVEQHEMETGLSQENAEFLNSSKFKENYLGNIRLLEEMGLAQWAPSYEQSIALLAKLHKTGEIDLDKIRELDAMGYGFELVIAPEHMSEDEIQALVTRQKGYFTSCKNIFRFRVNLIAAADEKNIPRLPFDNTPDHCNNGANYDSSRIALLKDKMSFPAITSFVVLAMRKLEDLENIDSDCFSILDIGERRQDGFLFVGTTFGDMVVFNGCNNITQTTGLHIRPSSGGIFLHDIAAIMTSMGRES